ERGADRDHAVELDRAAVDVGPGQEGQRAVRAVDGHDLLEAGDVARQVRVREAHALRLARGARRVDEEGDVLRVVGDGRHVAFFARFHEGGEPIVAGRVEIDDMLELGKLTGEAAHALGDGVAGDEAHAGGAVFEDELPVAVELRLVHGDPDGAEREGGVGADGPLEAVVADDGHAIAALDAARGEGGARLVDERAELGVAGPLPSVALAGAEDGTVAVFGDDVTEHAREIVEPWLECHGASVYTQRVAIGLALLRGATARWRPMSRLSLVVAVAVALASALTACGSTITVPDQG